MRIGISLSSSFQVQDPRMGARFMVERAAAARRAGLDSLFVGDHHATPQPYYQNTPIMGRLLAEWGDKPAGCLFLLPLWSPVLVAEQVGTLASIAQGRFIFQCGLGDGQDQFGAMGADVKRRPSAFEESFDVIKRLLAGQEASASKRFSVSPTKLALRPAEPVEYWIGASAESAIDRAARIGDGWLASPGLTPDQARTQLDYYRARCKAHGRTPAAIAARRDIYVGESRAEAEAVAGPIVARGYRGFKPEALVWGSVADVTARFKELGAMGYTDVIVRHLTNDQRKVLASLGRLAEVRAALTNA